MHSRGRNNSRARQKRIARKSGRAKEAKPERYSKELGRSVPRRMRLIKGTVVIPSRKAITAQKRRIFSLRGQFERETNQKQKYNVGRKLTRACAIVVRAWTQLSAAVEVEKQAREKPLTAREIGFLEVQAANEKMSGLRQALLLSSAKSRKPRVVAEATYIASLCTELYNLYEELKGLRHNNQ